MTHVGSCFCGAVRFGDGRAQQDDQLGDEVVPQLEVEGYGAFAVHPRGGIETVTFVIEGTVKHYDNAGHTGVVKVTSSRN
jgi:redox-sensitive bicupin YhaK (pirin superfamily)